MIRFLLAFLSWFGAFFRSRHDLGLELVALRQQVGGLKPKNPRPQLRLRDRLFWLALRRWWSKWASALVIVKPQTVVGWQRARSAATGASFRAAVLADRQSPLSFAVSSDPWRPRIRLGVLPGSTASS